MDKLRTEEEIISRWSIKDKPKVSINCITYNHEQYIADAIEGFLKQETDFPFEILIHDDASTDRTQQIIKKYEAVYPSLIKPIYQKENQYKKVKRITSINNSKAKGEYIALCEGDDYWTDKTKLQKQAKILDRYPNVMLCVHATRVEKLNYKDSFSNNIKLANNDRIFEAEEVIVGGGFFGHTSSFMFRATVLEHAPDWYFDAPVGDLSLSLLCCSKGTMYYLDEEMSVYRRGVKGSWTEHIENPKNRILHANRCIKMYEDYDRYTNFKFEDEVNVRLKWYASEILSKIEHYNTDFNQNKNQLMNYLK